MLIAAITDITLIVAGSVLILTGWIVLGMPFAPWNSERSGVVQRDYARLQGMYSKHRGRVLGSVAVMLAGFALIVMVSIGVFDETTRSRAQQVFDTMTRSPDEPIPRGR